MASIPLPALNVQQQPQPDILGNYAKALSVRDLINRQQLQPGLLQEQQNTLAGQNMDLQQKQIELNNNKILTGLYSKFTTGGNQGTQPSDPSAPITDYKPPTGYDWDGLRRAAVDSGVTLKGLQQINSMQKEHEALSEQVSKAGAAQIDLQNKANNSLGEAVQTLLSVPQEQRQATLQGLIPNLQQAGIDPTKLANAKLDNDSLLQFNSTLGQHAQMNKDAKETAEATGAQQKVAKPTGAQIDTFNTQTLPSLSNLTPGLQQSFSKQAAQARTVDEFNAVVKAAQDYDKTPAAADTKYRQTQAAIVSGQPVTDADRAAASAYEDQKAASPLKMFKTQQGALSPEAVNMAGQNFVQTGGQLPAGIRSPAMASTIMNRAATMTPGAPPTTPGAPPKATPNLAGNKAGYAADTASYNNVTGTLDTLSAFENSGLKNLKQFTTLAAKLPDTGVPWINTPVRKITPNMLGTDAAQYMPAINAARDVALREIARVTNDPKLSGSLTDSARQEVNGFIPESATFPQIVHVAQVLQQDMANVHSSMAQKKNEIGARLGIQPTEEAAPEGGGTSNSGAATTHTVGETVNLKNGKTVKVTAVHPDGTWDAK